jgi:Lon-like ATP-dependent protease
MLMAEEKKSLFGSDKDLPPLPTESKILEDMEARKATIEFDLTSDYWEEHPEEFWEKFRHTDQILVPHRFEDWIIGQDEAREKLRLNLIEWPRKLRDLTKMAASKTPIAQILKERPGPYILLIGEPGTGKSLLIKVAAEYLEDLYEREGIGLYDVLALKNPNDEMTPLIRYTHAGEGRKIVAASHMTLDKEAVKFSVMKYFLFFVIMLGGLFLFSGIFLWLYFVNTQDPAIAWWVLSGIWQPWLMIGVFMTFFPMLILVFLWMRGSMGMNTKTLEGANHPALLVDNSEPKFWIDATIANQSLMFGDVEWDRFGNSKAGHHRLKAGDIHKAHRKLLYIDEIKNLDIKTGVEFLQVMEDGASEIKGHQGGGGSSHTASQMVKSGVKIDCVFFLIAAGNMDIIHDPNSILNKLTALRDRMEGYGDVILMKDEMDDTPLNRMKVAQVITDETYRFNFPPVTRDAVLEIISHMRQGASSNKKLRMRFRRVIGILRRGAQFAWDEGDEWIRPDHIERAIKFNVPIERAEMEDLVEKGRKYKIIQTEGTAIGLVNGLVIISSGHSEYFAGDVAPVAAWMHPVDDPKKADFIVTGVAGEKTSEWVQDSIRAVRTSIFKMYDIDLAKDFYVHVSFLQSAGVDGPSAGTTMTLAIMSLLGDPDVPLKDRKPMPIRQDMAVTGTVEIAAIGKNNVRVGPIGGAWEKCMGAAAWGLKGCIVPMENYQNTLDKAIQKHIRVVPASTIKAYFKILTEL